MTTYRANVEQTPPPEDMVTTTAEHLAVTLSPTDDGTQLAIGLQMTLPGVIGNLRVLLGREQTTALHHDLAALMLLSERQVQELIDNMGGTTK